jgi:hypothetical protein
MVTTTVRWWAKEPDFRQNKVWFMFVLLGIRSAGSTFLSYRLSSCNWLPIFRRNYRLHFRGWILWNHTGSRPRRPQSIFSPHFGTKRSARSQVHLYWNQSSVHLTPWSVVLLDDLAVLSANQEPPRVLWYPGVLYRVYRSPSYVPFPSQMHQVRTLQTFLPEIHFSIIFTSASRPPVWFILFRLSELDFLNVSSLAHACCMPRPSHPSWMGYRIVIIMFGEVY